MATQEQIEAVARAITARVYDPDEIRTTAILACNAFEEARPAVPSWVFQKIVSYTADNDDHEYVNVELFGDSDDAYACGRGDDEASALAAAIANALEQT